MTLTTRYGGGRSSGSGPPDIAMAINHINLSLVPGQNIYFLCSFLIISTGTELIMRECDHSKEIQPWCKWFNLIYVKMQLWTSINHPRSITVRYFGKQDASSGKPESWIIQAVSMPPACPDTLIDWIWNISKKIFNYNSWLFTFLWGYFWGLMRVVRTLVTFTLIFTS